MKIITANTNGIRAAAKKGFFDWLADQKADVVCIQETKAQVDQLSDEIFHPKGYHTYYSKKKPNHIQFGIGWEDMDSEGRWLQADFDNISVISLYLPSGSSKEERQAFKYDLMYRMTPLGIFWRPSQMRRGQPRK